MNRKTIYVLVCVLVIGLAAVGVGYGLWFEDLKLHGEVTTGELDVELSLYGTVEWFTDEYNVITVWPDTPGFEEKFDTVDCEGAFVTYNGEFWQPLDDSPLDSPLDNGPEIIKFEVTGMYPSYHCLLKFDIHNTGTVPVHLYSEFSGDEALIDDFTCIPPGNGNGEVHCTRTRGYWSTHSIYGPAPYDATWADIGEDTPFYLSGKTWYEAINTPPKGDAYYILAPQYIAARLNEAAGADVSTIETVLADAEAWLLVNPPPIMPGDPYRDLIIGWAEILDDYNNGDLPGGPPHCDITYNDNGDNGGDMPYDEDLFQLHQGDWIDCFIELHFTNDDYFAEGETYEFQYEIRAYQWNESLDPSTLLWPYNWQDIKPPTNP